MSTDHDGRILTPPEELEPRLKSAFPAFSKLLGHIRWIYVADEIWDGKTSLVFKADSEQLAAITFDDGVFYIHIADKDFRIVDETLLDTVFEALKKTASPGRRRPLEQHTVNLSDPDEYHCGHRCDMCLGSKKYNENDPSGHGKFDYINWVCYHNCVPNVNVERDVNSIFVCPGCKIYRKQHNCQKFYCPTEKGYANCVECGKYHSCDVHRGSHYPGQCNSGLTAKEVTSLVIPYCIKERLDAWRKAEEK